MDHISSVIAALLVALAVLYVLAAVDPIKSWFRQGVGTSRGRRIAFAFLLTPFVTAMVVLVSTFPDSRDQALLLALTTTVWLIALFAVRLPDDADDDYADLRDWGRRHRSLVIPVAAVLVFLILTVKGFNAGLLVVQASLLLWPFGLLLYQTRRFVSRAWRGVSWGLALVTAVLVLGIPIVTLVAANELGYTWSLWIAVGLVAVPTILVFVALFWLNADAVERAAPEQMTKYAQTRTPEVDEAARERPRGSLAIVSIGCVVLSSLLLLASAIRVPIERRSIETSQVAERGPNIGGPRPEVLKGIEERNEEALKELYGRYYPVLRLHEGEDWIAYNASEALAAAFTDPPAEDCAERAERPCTEAAFEDEERLARLDDARLRKGERVFPGGAVYPRLVDVQSAVRALGDEVPAFARSTKWIVQFWLFYPNNEWSSESAVGSLVQKHGGDWEWVGVGINRQAAPVFVAYSAHCGGSWRPWKEVASVAVVEPARVIVGGDPMNPASHPLVIVADGSHANYPTPGTREPDWGTCQFGGMPFAAAAMRWLTFITAAREGTPDLGAFQVPKVLTDADTERDAKRAIWWGKEGQTKFGPILIASDEHGPASPVYQHDPWDRPMDTVFDGDWECDAGKDACEGAEASTEEPPA